MNFNKKVSVKDTVSNTIELNDALQMKEVMENKFFKSFVISLPDKDVTVAPKGKGYTIKSQSIHKKDDAEVEIASIDSVLDYFNDGFPFVCVKVNLSVPLSHMSTMKDIAKRYVTRQASGGRKLCKRKKFNKDEEAYCQLNSQLYAKNVALSMDTHLTMLNLNTIVFGGSGAGKSRFFVEPNLLQANSSYVVTDPSGELMAKTGKYLESQGYTLKCLNIERMELSMRYNPFAYVEEDSDIPLMVDALISNIEGPKKGGGGDNKFWDETSRTLLIAICGYLFETQPMEKRNFNNVVRLIDMMDVSDDRETPEDELDKLFNDLEAANPSSYAVSNYKVIKSAGTGKTAQNIVISTLAIFARFFKLDKIANLTYKDELHLEELGQKKCALFIVTPQGDTTYNFLASELYTQLFNILYKQGEENARKRHTTSVAIDVPVRCMIDEAANVGEIPGLPTKVSTMRKYGIAISLIYQNQAQVKALMEKEWEVIVGNCDTMLFLGGIDASTVKIVSERLGKGTLNTKSNNLQNAAGSLLGGVGSKGSSINLQTTGRNLMDTNEIEQMENDRCIVFIRSMKPFKDFKYPLEQHPNYKYSGDAGEEHFYTADWYIELDHKLLNDLRVYKTSDSEYKKPEKVAWVSDEEVERVKREQQQKKDSHTKKDDKTPQSAPNSIDNVLSSSATQSDGVMSEEEKSEIEQFINEKHINLGLNEGLKIWNMSKDEAVKFLTLKEGYAPDLEFTDKDYPVPDELFKDIEEQSDPVSDEKDAFSSLLDEARDKEDAVEMNSEEAEAIEESLKHTSFFKPAESNEDAFEDEV